MWNVEASKAVCIGLPKQRCGDKAIWRLLVDHDDSSWPDDPHQDGEPYYQPIFSFACSRHLAPLLEYVVTSGRYARINRINRG